MQTEIEAKFLNVDHELLRAKLRERGAVLVQPMRTMQRCGYDFPGGKLRTKHNAWVRIRDEGNAITMSYKQLNDRSLTGTKEVCVTVDSLEQAAAFLRALGLEQTGTIQQKRESWRLGDVEVDLDEWPWIRPFVEIEGKSQAALQETAAQLGLEWSEALHGSVEVAYMAEYDVSESEVYGWPEFAFVPVPAWLAAKRKKVAA